MDQENVHVMCNVARYAFVVDIIYQKLFQFWTLKLLAFVHCERYF